MTMRFAVILLLAGAAQAAGPGEGKETSLVFPPRLHVPVRKATPFHLFLYVQNRVKVRDPQGIAVTRLDSWDDPKEKKDDDEITVYGVNSGQNVIIYNTSMTTISIYGLKERGVHKLNRPHGITASSWGDVYLADTYNNRVVKFHNPGKKLQFERVLTGDGMRRPHDVSLTADSTLYVTDYGNDRLLMFRADTLARVIAGAGVLRHPTGVAATCSAQRWSYWKDDFVVVIDQDGRRLQKFLRDGTLVKSVTMAEVGVKGAELSYAEIDYHSNIWVTDKKNHCLHKFDRDLNYLTRFGSKGSGDNQFVEPRGISMYRRFGQVLIAEKKAAQYYWIGTDIDSIRFERTPEGMLLFRYFLTEPSYMTLEIFDKNGKPVATPLKKVRRSSGAGFSVIAGDGSLLSGYLRDGIPFVDEKAVRDKPVFAAGEYRFLITLSATYSSYTYFKKNIEKKVHLH